MALFTHCALENLTKQYQRFFQHLSRKVKTDVIYSRVESAKSDIHEKLLSNWIPYAKNTQIDSPAQGITMSSPHLSRSQGCFSASSEKSPTVHRMATPGISSISVEVKTNKGEVKKKTTKLADTLSEGGGNDGNDRSPYDLSGNDASDLSISRTNNRSNIVNAKASNSVNAMKGSSPGLSQRGKGNSPSNTATKSHSPAKNLKLERGNAGFEIPIAARHDIRKLLGSGGNGVEIPSMEVVLSPQLKKTYPNMRNKYGGKFGRGFGSTFDECFKLRKPHYTTFSQSLTEWPLGKVSSPVTDPGRIVFGWESGIDNRVGVKGSFAVITIRKAIMYTSMPHFNRARVLSSGPTPITLFVQVPF